MATAKIWIDSPSNNDWVKSSAPITVRGRAGTDLPPTSGTFLATVELGQDGVGARIVQLQGKRGEEQRWSLTVTPAASWDFTVHARAEAEWGEQSADDAADITLRKDDTAPALTITSPGAQSGQPVPIVVPEVGLALPVTAQAKDDDSGVARVEVSIDNNTSYVFLKRDNQDPSLWKSDPGNPPWIPGTPWKTGIRKLYVRAADRVGHLTEHSLDFVGVDNSAPQHVINAPVSGKKIPWSAPHAVIAVDGTASDQQTGIKFVKCKLVDSAGNVVDEQSDPSVAGKLGQISWSVQLAAKDPGWYRIDCEFCDAAGNSVTDTVPNIEVAEAFKPTDLNDLLGSRQYLHDLLKFFKVHFKKKSGSNFVEITPDDLKKVFFQDFARLADLTDAATAQRPLNAVRLSIEVLRKYLDGTGGVDAAVEAQYVQTAYETLLQQFGTSYAELRLTRGAEDSVRHALAARLGIDLIPNWSLNLDALLLQPTQFTEAKLKSLFGLVATDDDPFQATTPGQLFDWQLRDGAAKSDSGIGG